jgi:hypothetical protein
MQQRAPLRCIGTLGIHSVTSLPPAGQSAHGMTVSSGLQNDSVIGPASRRIERSAMR